LIVVERENREEFLGGLHSALLDTIS